MSGFWWSEPKLQNSTQKTKIKLKLGEMQNLKKGKAGCQNNYFPLLSNHMRKFTHDTSRYCLKIKNIERPNE